MSEKKEKKEKEQKNTAEAEPSRRSRKKQNTHKAILHQAKVLFEKEGIGNVTIEQISESADVSRSTFFSHFASVDDLLKEISDEEINDVFEAARKGDGELTVSALLKQLNDDTIRIFPQRFSCAAFSQKASRISRRLTVFSARR